MRSLRILAFLGLAAGALPSAAARLSESETRFVADAPALPHYGVLWQQPSEDELRREHAHVLVSRMREELSQDGALSPESRAEARYLQYSRYDLLDSRDRALVEAALSLRLGGFSVTGPDTAIAVPPSPPVSPEVLAPQDFPNFLKDVRTAAAAEGVPAAVLDDALTGVAVDPGVLAAENAQAEHTITLEQYLSRVVTDKRVARGRQELAQRTALLDKLLSSYHVPADILVSIWGMESNYGANQGTMQVVRSLATLAYQGKRPVFFRQELMAALHILAEEHMAASDLKGSWAGALGQCQFMPSTYRRLAVDFDGDGRRDIWTNPADVLASMANYISQAGWDPAAGWGQEVALPADFVQTLAGLAVIKPVSDWQKLGVQALAGAVMPAAVPAASIIRPSGPGGRAFLVLPNFRVVLRYNNSSYYATAGGLLADRIKAKGKLKAR